MGVKYVLIVFGLTYAKGALLMISLTSVNTICKKASDCKKASEHCKIFKACSAILQLYAWKGQ